jgi:hypothetical protein
MKKLGLILVILAMLLVRCDKPKPTFLVNPEGTAELHAGGAYDIPTSILEPTSIAQSIDPLPIEPAYELVLPDGSHYAYVWEQETNAGTICVWTEGSYDPVCSCPCEVDCIIEETTVITIIEPTPVEPTPVEPTPTPVEPPVECKPGWGHGDKNHCHDGPPGQTNK